MVYMRNGQELGELAERRRGVIGKEGRKAKIHGRWFTLWGSDQSEIPSDRGTKEL